MDLCPCGNTINGDKPYLDSGAGPFCDECLGRLGCTACDGTGTGFVKRNGKGEIDYMSGTPTSEETECVVCRGEGWRQ